MKAILIFLFFLPSTALTKTIFEPSLSLNSGGFTGEASGSSNIANGTPIDASYTTFSAGFRYGITRRYIHVTGVFEGHMVNMSVNDLGANSGVNTDLQFQSNIGLGIGYEWNIPLRTYLILGTPFSSVEFAYYFSESIVVGLKYSKMEFDFSDTELSVSTFGVAVSFPFEFEYPDHWWRKTDWE